MTPAPAPAPSALSTVPPGTPGSPRWPRSPAALLGALLLLPALAGCTGLFSSEEPDGTTYAEMGYTGSDPTGRDPDAWPDLPGTLRILDHGSFSAFDDAAAQFELLTGMEVRRDDFGDTGSSLNVAIREAGDPSFDVFYGIDNILYAKAVEAGVLDPFRPKLAGRIDADLVFFDPSAGWHATPVDHGYIGVNWDPSATLESAPLLDLHDVLANAGRFVTEDPRLSTPGLGFLLSTIATFGEPHPTLYDWHDYWTDLLEGGVLVTADWTTAYEQHFSAGYGADYGGLADKPIVTSYTNSPAYEHFAGRNRTAIARNVLAPEATFHQIQTMGVLEGTRNLAGAQAWVEFTLTDFFQELAAPQNAVYPAVPGIPVEDTYQGLDPVACDRGDRPGCFRPAELTTTEIGDNLDRWLDEWVGLCEDHDCA